MSQSDIAKPDLVSEAQNSESIEKSGKWPVAVVRSSGDGSTDFSDTNEYAGHFPDRES